MASNGSETTAVPPTDALVTKPAVTVEKSGDSGVQKPDQANGEDKKVAETQSASDKPSETAPKSEGDKVGDSSAEAKSNSDGSVNPEVVTPKTDDKSIVETAKEAKTTAATEAKAQEKDSSETEKPKTLSEAPASKTESAQEAKTPSTNKTTDETKPPATDKAAKSPAPNATTEASKTPITEKVSEESKTPATEKAPPQSNPPQESESTPKSSNPDQDKPNTANEKPTETSSNGLKTTSSTPNKEAQVPASDTAPTANIPTSLPQSSTPASKPTTAPVKATPPVATVAPMPKTTSGAGTKHTASQEHRDENAPPQKKARVSGQGSSKGSSGGSGGAAGGSVVASGNRTPHEILVFMDKTFEQRRRIITKQMPTIPELQRQYPDLFMHKQLLTEFQRITKIDIDQKIQEFCVRFATAVIEMARHKKAAAPVIERWKTAQKENKTLKQYWDMMTALCLLPLHFGENFSDMVQEIGEDEQVQPQGKIVPVLVARGNIFRTDEFYLIAENTIVQEFEEFTIALASLYSSYWVFNMVYPDSVENTYNYIQRCIVRQKEPGSVPAVCRNFTKALQKWNKDKESK